MSDTIIKMIIIIIPILIYSIIQIWTNWRINSILTNKIDRKKYKRYFNKLLSTFFSPLFLFSVVLVMIFFPEQNKLFNLGIIIIILKGLTAIISGVLSSLYYKELMGELTKLKNKCSPDDLLNAIRDGI